jgi:hypothetical protein
VNNKKDIPISFENKKKSLQKSKQKIKSQNFGFFVEAEVSENRNKKIKNIFDFFSFSKKEKNSLFSFLPLFSSGQSAWRFLLCAYLHSSIPSILSLCSLFAPFCFVHRAYKSPKMYIN